MSNYDPLAIDPFAIATLQSAINVTPPRMPRCTRSAASGSTSPRPHHARYLTSTAYSMPILFAIFRADPDFGVWISICEIFSHLHLRTLQSCEMSTPIGCGDRKIRVYEYAGEKRRSLACAISTYSYTDSPEIEELLDGIDNI